MARRKTFRVSVRFKAYHDANQVYDVTPEFQIRVRCVKPDTALKTALGHGRSKLSRAMAALWTEFLGAHESADGWKAQCHSAKVISVTEGGVTTIF